MTNVISFRREAEPLPQNVEAEQALLGTILSYSDVWADVAPILKPEHFSESLHARIYEEINALSVGGKFVSPIVLKSRFDTDDTLAQIGGWTYITRLMGAAGPRIGARGYAQLIRNDADRRAIIRAADDVRKMALEESKPAAFRQGLSEHISGVMRTYEGSNERKTSYTMAEAGRAATERLDRLASGEADPNSIATGIPALDKMTGGLRRQEYLIIGARPSMGKTALGVQLAANVAGRGGGVVYFSLEMPIMILHPRFVASRLWTPGHSSPSYQSILHGHVTETERRWAADVVAETSKWPLIVDDDAGLSAAELEARARVYAARLKAMGSNLDLVVVDHIHKMHSPGAQNRVAEYSEVSAGLAEAAKRLDCPLVALAQLNRGTESRDDKRPTLSDLRESGGLEQDADTVALLYRPAYYLDRERPRDANADVNRLRDLSNCSHELEVILAKQRSGPIGTVNLWADMASNVIRDPSEVAA